MARIWANRLEAGRRVWSEVPGFRKAAVLDVLRGDVAAGKLTAERYEEITGESYSDAEGEA